MKERHKNIFYVEDFEVVPAWKQCDRYDPNWSDDEKFLWNSGEFSHHMERVNSGDEFVEKCWYVWKGHRLFGNYITLQNNGTYVAHMKENMIGWDSGSYETLEHAVRYVMACLEAYKKAKKEEK